jgi:hypothetical protein
MCDSASLLLNNMFDFLFNLLRLLNDLLRRHQRLITNAPFPTREPP